MPVLSTNTQTVFLRMKIFYLNERVGSHDKIKVDHIDMVVKWFNKSYD